MNVALKRAREAAYHRARAEECDRESVRRNQLVAGNAEARQLQSDLDVGYGHELVDYGEKRDRLKTLKIGGPSYSSNRLLEKALEGAELSPELFHTWLGYLGEKHDGERVQELVLDALVAMEDNVDVFMDEERSNSVRKLKRALPGYNPTFHEAFDESFKPGTMEAQVLARLKIYIADMRWTDALTLLHLMHLGADRNGVGINMQKDLLNRSGRVLSFSDILESVKELVFKDAMQSFNSNAQ